MPLVVAISKSVPAGRLAQTDLCQEGSLALRKAALRFLPEQGTKFGTFATPVVKNHLLDVCRRERGLSDYGARQIEGFAFAKEQLAAELSRAPSDDEVFDWLGWRRWRDWSRRWEG